MADDKTLQYYLRQLRLIEEHREAGCESKVRKIYQDLLKDLKSTVGTQYADHADSDGKLTFEILSQKGKYASFLEEVEKSINTFTPEAAKEIKTTVKDTYKSCYDGMVDAVQKSNTSAELAKNLKGLKNATPNTIKNVVANTFLDEALSKNHKAVIYDIKQQIGAGLANGENISTMANRISEVVNKDYRKATQITRTETHRVREAGFSDSSKEINQILEDNDTDFVMVKIWRTMKDERVRPQRKAYSRKKGVKPRKTVTAGIRSYLGGPNHVKMEGVVVKTDEKFDLGSGVKADVPGSSGVAGHDINCRCFVEYDVVTKAEYEKLTGKKLESKEKPVQEVYERPADLEDDIKLYNDTVNIKDIEGTPLYESLKDDLENYVGGGYGSVKIALGNDELKIKYITDSMTDYDKPLYRMEESMFTFDRQNLKVGKTFSFEDDMRSFSRDKKYVESILGPYSDAYDYEEPVLFETVGKTKHFNMDKFNEHYFEDQSESLVGGKFKILEIYDDTIHGKNVKIVKIEQLDDISDTAKSIDKVEDTVKVVQKTSSFEEELSDYVAGGYGSPAEVLSKQNVEFVKSKMKETNNTLYRIEESQFTAKDMKLAVGDEFEFDSEIRSFSRSKRFIDDTLDDSYFEEPVIFKTVGTTRHFDVNEYVENDYFGASPESLVGGKFKVKRIYDDDGVTVFEIEQLIDKVEDTSEIIAKIDGITITANDIKKIKSKYGIYNTKAIKLDDVDFDEVAEALHMASPGEKSVLKELFEMTDTLDELIYDFTSMGSGDKDEILDFLANSKISSKVIKKYTDKDYIDFAKKDKKIITRTRDDVPELTELRKKMNLSYYDAEKFDDALSNTSDEFKALFEKHSDKLDGVIMYGEGITHYNPRNHTINMGSFLGTKEEVFLHEYGHFLDDMLVPGQLRETRSAKKDFLDALINDKKHIEANFTIDDIKDSLKEEQWITGNQVSDILEGLGFKQFSGHGDDYWDRYDRDKEVASELFAHLTTCQSNKNTARVFEKYFPNSSKLYKTIIKES